MRYERIAVCLLAWPLACHKPSAEPLRVAAASDLAFAFKDIGELYERQTGQKVTFIFGSTGLLAKQIAQGAPFDVFAAANVSFVDDVVKAGACAADSQRLYARGRIVVWTQQDSQIEAPHSIADLVDERFTKIAIANPEHAPYGRAAKEAFEHAGVWDRVKPKLVFGENVQQTLQFAQSGNADVAIVALSLAMVSNGRYRVIAEDEHQPIAQSMVVCGHAHDAAARAFTRLVNAREGREVMRRYGFLLPGELMTKSN
jgi:molybdate transport system substrate-binding protein